MALAVKAKAQIQSRVAQIPELTGLRAIAAFYVLTVHFGNGVTTGWPTPVRNFLSSGFLGVDLFFVLSGFVLAWNYAGPNGMTVGRRDFMIARAARILPAYYTALAMALPLFLLLEFREGVLPPAVWNTILTAVASITLTQAWILPWAWMWNNPGWSLSIEAFLYMTFPSLALRFSKWDSRLVLRWTVISYLATAAVSLLFAALHPHPSVWGWDVGQDYCPWPTLLGCNPVIHLHEFMMGIAVCLFIRREQSGVQREFLKGPQALWLAIGLLLVALGWRGPMPFISALCGIYSPLFALLIYGLVKEHGIIARFLGTKPMVFLGEISYALYLIHLTVWLNMEGYNREHNFLKQDSIENVLLNVLLSLVGAYLVYDFIEKPYRRVIRAKFAVRSAA